MDTRAPAVVAVVVTTGPGPDLEATLVSLVAQDYEDLSILVLANGESAEIASRVAAIAPLAFVKILTENDGYASAVNNVSGTVQGAAFLLLCHDDVRLRPNAIRSLVEAAYRTNAAIVSPKFVGYEDESALVHVGQMLDRFGAVVERIEEGEIDAGQHDAERDVFVAPGGVTLVRADLFESLGGYNEAITLIGEDVDFCWRAQIAGARVIVAPEAVVAHRQSLTSGRRAATAKGTRRTSIQELRRRHQLMTVLSSWGRLSLLLILPLLVVLDLAELVIAAAGRDHERVGAVSGAWSYVLRHRGEIRRRREFNLRLRVLSDGGIRLLQVSGSSRAQVFLQRLFHEGIDIARGTIPEQFLEPVTTKVKVSATTAIEISENPEFDLYASDAPAEVSIRTFFEGFRTQFTLVVVALLVWFIGARNLVAAHLPIVGRLIPLDSWWANWHHFFASWSPNGVGSGAPGMPGYGLIAAAGTLVGGRMGILPRAVLILAVPIGVYGVGRLLRDVISNRARLFAALSYMAMPVGVNLLQQGRTDLLIIFAGLPFLLRRVLALLNVDTFRSFPYEPSRPFGSRQWGRTRAGQIAKAVIVMAMLGAFAPVVFVLVALVVVALWLANRLTPNAERLEMPWRTLGQLVMGAALLLAPLTIDTVLAGRRALGVFGLPLGSWSNLDFSHIIRAADGVFGQGLLSWAAPMVVLGGVLLARGERRTMVNEWFVVLALVVLLTVAVARNLTGSFAPDVEGLLILVGLLLSVMVGVAVTVLEHDLNERALGWPQVAGVLTALALMVVPLPILTHATDGRYSLPQTSAAESLSAYTPATPGGYRVLWLADPRAMPMAGWSVMPGLAAATSMNGGPNGSVLFTPPASGTSDFLMEAVRLAAEGRTTHVGRLLAPAGISDIVVMTASVPPLAGLQSAVTMAPPASLLEGLDRQSDLALVSKSNGLLIYSNTQFHGIVAQRANPLNEDTTSSQADSVSDWSPVLRDDTLAGDVSSGHVIAGLAPSSAFALEVNGHAVTRHTRLGWVAAYETSGGKGQIVLHQFPLNGLLALFTVALWGLYLLGFGGSERLSEMTGRRHRSTPVNAAASDEEDDEVTDEETVES